MYTKEQLEIIIKQKQSYCDVLRYFQLNTSGGNYKKLKQDIQKWNLDISHFLTRKEILEKANKSVILSLDQILVENSKFNISGNQLKKRLFQTNLKENKCEECNQDENWRGKKLGLVLEHINGNHYDNRIENLKILCPNCHAITDTFAGKNRTSKKIKNKKKIIKENIKQEQLLNLKKQILESNIDFSKNGWGVKLSKLLDKSPSWCLKLVKEKFPELIK